MDPSSSSRVTGAGQSRNTMGNEEMRELLWHNGEVVMQQISGQDVDLSSWLQFSLEDFDGDYSHLLYSPPSGVTNEPMPPPPSYTSFYQYQTPIGPVLPQFLLAPFSSSIAAAGPSTICSTDAEGIAAAAPKFQSDLNFSWVPTGMESVPSSSMNAPREFTPAAAAKSAVQRSGWHVGGTSGASTSNARKDLATACEPTVAASPGASTASGSIEGTTPPVRKPTKAKGKGKRRVRDVENNDCQSDDDDHAAEIKNKSRKPVTVKRTRTAEVHNLAERRRREKINSKLKVLQGLIPNCNKTNKSSMLDHAIDYMKSLQLYVKIMSTGDGVMYPCAQQQYLAAMGMGMMRGMGMDMENGPGFPPQASGAAPSFPIPPFPMQPVPELPPNTSRTPPVYVQQYSTYNPLTMPQGPNQPWLSNTSVVDPYQHFTAFQEPQVPTRNGTTQHHRS